jgi:hypothetical protein
MLLGDRQILIDHFNSALTVFGRGEFYQFFFAEADGSRIRRMDASD